MIFLHIRGGGAVPDSCNRQKNNEIDSPEAIAILDNDLNIININKSFETFFQCSKDEVEGKSIIKTGWFQEIIDNEVIALEMREKGYSRRGIKKRGKDGEILFGDMIMYPIVMKEKQEGIYLICRDVSEYRESQDNTGYLVNRDSLTGLYNRDFFMKILLNEINEVQGEKIALLFFDFDNFRRINSTLGYVIGDEIIKIIAYKLERILSGNTVLARLSGNRFGIMVTGIDNKEGVIKRADEIIGMLDMPVRIEPYEIDISVSLGISIYPNHGRDKETLMENAEIAMYRAKARCGNSIELFADYMRKEIEEEFALVNDLKKALVENEFQLHYQPIVNLKSNEVVGAEALLRWRHPKRGFISPNKFIPLAEDNGLILPIGEWVMKTACLQNKRWQNLGCRPIKMAVNVSAKQLEQKNFVEQIIKILDDTMLDPQFLELEITESLYIKNMDNYIDDFRRLNQLGVKISIDDFGTGYSSLSQLKNLAINRLKIDKSFIDDIRYETDDNPIISAIMTIAKGLNLSVIAEGIETSSQLNYLKKIDCEMGQGYVLSRPLSTEGFEKLLMEK